VLLQLVIYNSVAGGMCFRYGGGTAAFRERVTISSGRSVKHASHEFDKEHVKCIVNRIPNDSTPPKEQPDILPKLAGRISLLSWCISGSTAL
jgi:hypothetical protein